MAAQKMDIHDIPAERIPRHIAVIMDGNGRWAKRRGLPRTAGADPVQLFLKRIDRAFHSAFAIIENVIDHVYLQ